MPMWFALIDFEFKNEVWTGLHLIDDRRLKDNAVLVTGHYDEKDIQEEAVKAGVKILPKIMIREVPIKLVGQRKVTGETK